MAYTKQVPNFSAEGTSLPSSTLSGGFQAGEKPPANWFNFLFSSICQALLELQDKSYEESKLSTDLANYLTTAIIKQASGTSTSNLMSQKAITDYVVASVNELPKITKGTGNPSGGSDGDIYIKYS